MGPDQLATAKDIAVATTMIAGPVGMGLSLLTALRVTQGPRRLISWCMMIIGAAILALFFADEWLSLPYRLTDTVFILLWAAFLFLGLMALVYWPTRNRWVNLPLVGGVGVSLLAAVAHALFMTWGAWLAVTGAS